MMDSLLVRPPEEGARRLALSFLDQAAAAFPRLDDPADSEALHDFRVGLRRLRSCLRAYREVLAGCVPKKLARRLRRLAAATGPGRDAEVQIEWLRSRGKHLTRNHRAGLSWQLGRLDERLRAAYAELTGHLGARFPDLEKDLRHHLSVYQTEVHLGADGPHPTLGTVTAAILRSQLEELADHLTHVRGAGDVKEAHRARISAKRLRYLLEPLAEELPAAPPLVKRLKKLQDLLGELHDAHVQESDLAAAVATAAAERAHHLFTLALDSQPDEARLRAARRRSHEPGLLALAHQNRQRRDELFAEVETDWLDGKAEGFLEQVRALAGEMEGAA
ncbi:MAG TPA: CHAD domain-containing protein [Thermoanaerobaculia bacterium]|jgi:CHAD domain-containing protein|nr:CHAD domain-containing protein [Thermoanaerobaculia bacterium]